MGYGQGWLVVVLLFILCNICAAINSALKGHFKKDEEWDD